MNCVGCGVDLDLKKSASFVSRVKSAHKQNKSPPEGPFCSKLCCGKHKMERNVREFEEDQHEQGVTAYTPGGG